MTLSTDIYVHGEIGALDVFNFVVHQLLEFDADHRDFTAVRTTAEADADYKTKTPSPDGRWTMQTVIDQGLPAWTMVHYRPRGGCTARAPRRRRTPRGSATCRAPPTTTARSRCATARTTPRRAT